MFQPAFAIKALQKVLYHSDEPVAGLSVVAQYEMLEMIRKETDVVVLLSGQGADEILLGYLKFFFLHIKSMLARREYAQALKHLLASFLRGTSVWQFQFSMARRYIPSLANNDLNGSIIHMNPLVPIWEITDQRSRQIHDIDLFSVPALAHYEDRNAMAHSLEVRHPFLDHRLVSFALNLPVDLKLKNGWTKYVLRESLPELPSAIRWRRDKQGFVIPEKPWLCRELVGDIRAVFERSRLEELDLLDAQKFLVYYDDFLAGKPIAFGDISRALIAEIWARQFFPVGSGMPEAIREPVTN